MTDLVETLIEDVRWKEVGLASLAEVAARNTLTHLALDPNDFAISLMGCDDVCPKDLPLATQIAFLRRKMALAGIR